MPPSVYWIGMRESQSEGCLAIIAWPRGGDWLEDEVTGWKAEGVDTVVSLLEHDEAEELGLSQEARLCSQEGMEFISFPIPDGGVPASVAAVADLADALTGKLRNGKNIAIHCRAGIGRSPVVAACVMIGGGFTAALAFDRISAVRGVQVPDTKAQRAWVEKFPIAGYGVTPG